jgi:two-component sensor histidine kinase
MGLPVGVSSSLGMAEERIGRGAAGGEPGVRSGLRLVYYLAAVALALLVPLTLFAGFWLRQEFGKSRRDLQDNLEARATTLQQRVDSEFQQEITVLQAIAALPSLDQPDIDEFHRQADRMVAAMPEWGLIRLIDAASGRELATTQKPPGMAPPQADAPEAVAEVVATRRPAIRTRAPEAGGVYAEHAILLFVPVLRENAVRYVLVAGAQATTVQKMVAEEGTDPRLLVLVGDERDRIIARSRSPERFVGRDVHEELRRATSGLASGVFIVPTPDGQDVFTAFRRSPSTGWLFVVATDHKQFERIAERSTWATIAAVGLSLAIALILAVFLFYNVMERRLAAERLAASRALSDLDARLLATTQEALAEQRKASSEREVLLREIYHRVKNNLQIVQSLLRLGSRDLAPEQREAFESAIRRIGAMARVHTLLYNSADLASIEMGEYLDGLVKEVADAFGARERGIRTVVEAEPMRVPLDTAVPLAFIAVEVLTNALKHAFPLGRKGTITVTAKREGERGILAIADDGVGFQPRPPEGRRALGLTIVSKLVQQIEGTLEQPKEGESTFRVEFPLGSTDEPATEAPLPAEAGRLRRAAGS